VDLPSIATREEASGHCGPDKPITALSSAVLLELRTENERSAHKEIWPLEFGDLATRIRREFFGYRWASSLTALRLALRRSGLAVTPALVSLAVPARQHDELRQALESLAQANELDGAELANFDENLERAKYDSLIPRDLSQTCRRDRTPADLSRTEGSKLGSLIRVSNFIQTAAGNGHTLSNDGDVDSRLVSHERVSCQRLIRFGNTPKKISVERFGPQPKTRRAG
jgi:hypothetical protein